MTEVTLVNLDDIKAAMKVIDDFNKLDLYQVWFVENDEVLNIAPEVIDEWRHVGLSNQSFVETRFWEDNSPHSYIRGNLSGES